MAVWGDIGHLHSLKASSFKIFTDWKENEPSDQGHHVHITYLLRRLHHFFDISARAAPCQTKKSREDPQTQIVGHGTELLANLFQSVKVLKDDRMGGLVTDWKPLRRYSETGNVGSWTLGKSRWKPMRSSELLSLAHCPVGVWGLSPGEWGWWKIWGNSLYLQYDFILSYEKLKHQWGIKTKQKNPQNTKRYRTPWRSCHRPDTVY